ncbi:hypothetical protein SAMN02745673_02859 [Marinactinospora thermotolerans DSM 45154]|uniref:Pilus assembly protein Flp/PilA n=1 Tax=Marinactinospora thermotolerans DSM 45154 TaxID=1122192 RepID=A0A1T4RQ75_9ACTN|nr:hypothetical protein [Marinactinospora thermotolerans]SKA17791.1 hypothetical protein SAMN02745673_02859 [Marinactinospora thermotolerans DSM 45154]
MQNPLVSAYVKARTALANRTHALRAHGDEGAGFVEYAAIIVLVAAIAGVVLGTDIGSQIMTGITGKITEILSGT